RLKLSGAYRRTLRFVLRSAVPLSLLLVIEAPRLTRVLLGDEWMPMASILRWLVIFSLCRPVQDDVHSLLLGIGQPRRIVQFVAIQAGILFLAAPLLTRSLGVKGTALSMDVMAAVGIVLALRCASRYVDVPWIRSLAPPLLSAAAALVLRLTLSGPLARLPDLVGLLAGGAVFLVLYGAALLAMERRTLLDEFRTVWVSIRSGDDPDAIELTER
ncbi:MAG: polysaccharide biosynthesis C-terminal domain-containing protein, partial [Candidatus Latescibacteria bacterium]|nr:polysaccharide biosynthesis C-terminal domain-containing protein [Candidatus Latescibacterota bacterium]